MGLQPPAEVVTGNIDGLVRLVAGVDLGVDGMGVCNEVFQEAMHVGGE
jgi:hypothetical protein